MKIGVVGGRNRADKEFIHRILDTHCSPGDIIISGGAPGVDSIAADYALFHGYESVIFPPLEPSRRWYLARNQQIAEACDILIAFPDTFSPGTYDTIRRVKAMLKTVKVYGYSGGSNAAGQASNTPESRSTSITKQPHDI